MQRTKKKEFKKADAILTADWHLQESVPVCRTDNFWSVQWKKLDFISILQKKHNCPVIHSGDLFDFWKPSPMLLSKTIEHLPDWFWTIYGNHDLPQHNMDLAHKSGVYTLDVAKVLDVLPCMGSWGMPPERWDGYELPQLCEKPFYVWHVMTYQGKEPFPGCTDAPARSLLRKYPKYDLIVTGDNHKPFTETHEGRLLVNPGSIFRTTAAQQNHKPRVYLWYAETNTVEAVFLPIEENVISREHIEEKEQRDDRIDAFINSLDDNWQAEMSFEDNIEKFRSKNKVSSKVMEIIYQSLES